MRFLSAALLCAMLPAFAHADSSNPTSGSGGGFSGSGTLTTSFSNGTYTVTGITGTGVNYLVDIGGFNNNDNLLFPNDASVVDAQGFSFSDTQGDTSFLVDLYSDSGTYYAYLLDSDGNSDTIPISFSVSQPPSTGSLRSLSGIHSGDATSGQTYNFAFNSPAATPEPSSLLLMATGMLGAASAVRRRFGLARLSTRHSTSAR